MDLEEAYTNAQVWERFSAPGFGNALLARSTGLPSAGGSRECAACWPADTFKAAAFADEAHNKVLRELEADIDAVKLDGQDVPVKLQGVRLSVRCRWRNGRCCSPAIIAASRRKTRCRSAMPCI